MAERQRGDRWLIWWAAWFVVCMVASVLVAWWCSVRMHPGVRPAHQGGADESHPLVQVMLRYGEFRFDKVTFADFEQIGLSHAFVRAERKNSREERNADPYRRLYTETAQMGRFRAGWPVMCVEGKSVTINGVQETHALIRAPAWIVRSTMPDASLGPILPTRPLWAGLLINAAVLGMPVHLLFAAYGLRRATRQRGNKCVGCGYDLRGTDDVNTVCPECGPRR